MKNTDLAYLLGMIVGKGTIKRGSSHTEIIIEIPHKLLQIDGMNTTLSVKASMEDIRNILEPLIGTSISSSSSDGKTIIQFHKPNGDFLIREINRHLGHLSSWKDFRIPQEIMDASRDVKREFMIGLADVTAHIRRSNSAYGFPFNHRVYIEIPQNWFLVADIGNILASLDVPIHVINWGHPNTRDPNLKDYKKGNKNASFREHQIKIFAEEFEKVGFRIEHKKKSLATLADLNKSEWNKFVQLKIKRLRTDACKKKWAKKLNHIESEHYKFYWETNSPTKKKPCHPQENDSRIPEKIRGKHFDSWKEICKALGYKQVIK